MTVQRHDFLIARKFLPPLLCWKFFSNDFFPILFFVKKWREKKELECSNSSIVIPQLVKQRYRLFSFPSITCYGTCPNRMRVIFNWNSFYFSTISFATGFLQLQFSDPSIFSSACTFGIRERMLFALLNIIETTCFKAICNSNFALKINSRWCEEIKHVSF